MVERKDYIDVLRQWKDEQVIKVVTGLRRCGKSTLLQMFRDELLKAGQDEMKSILGKDYHKYDLSSAELNAVRCPDAEKAKEMEKLILDVKQDGDTIGGVVSCVIKGCPVGLGEPAFSKLHAELGAAMMGINAVKGFEYGEGFDGVEQRGSEQNDIFYNYNGRISTRTNHSGGIQGGISNGQDIYFRVLFKPVATQLREQQTVDKNGNNIILQVKGRHDPCVLPRAVPIVEAMAAMAILDHFMLNKALKF